MNKGYQGDPKRMKSLLESQAGLSPFVVLREDQQHLTKHYIDKGVRVVIDRPLQGQHIPPYESPENHINWDAVVNSFIEILRKAHPGK